MPFRFKVQQQVHSYRNGHSLAGSSITLQRSDQDLIDRLSDLAGPLGPGETFSPYLTSYPLSSEPFYVVARTWQDLDAPRAGCVITRSLLVPDEAWRNGGVLGQLLAELESQGPATSRFAEFGLFEPQGFALPTLEITSTTEFVEAFFLEKRQPIVVFGASAPEVFAARLLEGLWPAFRSLVAICTNAYSPRAVQGRPFDVLFAPSSARSNFSAWTGRRVDGFPSNRQPRHGWTDSIARRLFDGPRVEPLTVSLGDLNVPQDEADESQFRLAMLWDELRQRSRESPLAILGMLDIVSSLRQGDASLSQALRPIISQSIRLAEKQGTQGLLQYLVTLLGKFPSRLPPTGALSEIRKSAATAAAREPEEALVFLKRQPLDSVPPAAVIMAGVADGFVRSRSVGQHIAELLSLGDEALLSLLGYGPRFAREVVDALESQKSAEGFARLERVAFTSDLKLRNRARRNMVPQLRNRGQDKLLKALLRGADGRALASSVRWLYASGGLEVCELGAALVSAADSPSKVEQLRALLSHLPASAGVNFALSRTLTLAEGDVDWLLSENLEPDRTSDILRELLENSSEPELRRLPVHLADAVLDSARLHEAAVGVESLSKILLLVPASCGAMLRVAVSKREELATSSNLRFVEVLVMRVLSEPAPPELALVAIEQFAHLVSARELALMTVGARASAEQVSENLRMFDRASPELRRHLASRVDVLTEQIIARRPPVPAVDAIVAWANLIAEAARQSNDGAHLRGASLALEFALRSTQVQVSPLVRAAFPRVYAELRSNERTPSMLDFFSFSDWDRCKTARKDLVQAFVHSVWPPVDLLVLADEVMEVESFSGLLSKMRSGRELLSRALADDTLPLHVRNAFVSRLEKP